jgi:hypothetical protein
MVIARNLLLAFPERHYGTTSIAKGLPPRIFERMVVRNVRNGSIS